MNFRDSKQSQQLELNLTPLIDVVFLLLIFFMVSTTFDKQSSLKIQLPEAISKNTIDKEQEKLEIIISRKGEYFINNRSLINQQFKTLKTALEKVAKTNRNLPVIIKADAKAPYQSVVRVMDAAGQIGLNHIIFPAKQPSNMNDYE